MSLRPRQKRNIVVHARPEAFVDRTVSILGRLGFDIYAIEDFDDLVSERSNADGGEELTADLRIVDERRLEEVEDEPGETPVPIILLTGRHGASGADSRIAGAAKKPAGLHDLYRLIQLILEDTPRSTPRVPIHLSTLCRRLGREWRASILSLSENGCLLRSPEPLPLGTQLDLSFELPRTGRVEVTADTAYQFVPDLGLVFNGVDPTSRDAIGSFVTKALLD